MSNPRDDQPLVPRRSLGKSPGSGRTAQPSASSGQQTATPAVTTPPYGGASHQAPVSPQADRTWPAPSGSDSAQASPIDSDETGRSEPVPAKAGRKVDRKGSGSSAKTRTMRRAKLRLLRVDPWSVTKAAFLLSIAFGIMCVVAVFLLFSIMSTAGLWDSINATIQGVLNQSPDEAFDINDYVGMDRVMAITMLIAAIDVVLITALVTLGAFIYNMSASLLGGIEVTLAEDLK